MKRLWLFLALLIASFTFADWGSMSHGVYSMHSGFGVGMFFVMGLFWLTLIAITVWAVNGFRRIKPASVISDDAVQIVRQRYAKGEISEAEMTQMLKTLE